MPGQDKLTNLDKNALYQFLLKLLLNQEQWVAKGKQSIDFAEIEGLGLDELQRIFKDPTNDQVYLQNEKSGISVKSLCAFLNNCQSNLFRYIQTLDVRLENDKREKINCYALIVCVAHGLAHLYYLQLCSTRNELLATEIKLTLNQKIKIVHEAINCIFKEFDRVSMSNWLMAIQAYNFGFACKVSALLNPDEVTLSTDDKVDCAAYSRDLINHLMLCKKMGFSAQDELAQSRLLCIQYLDHAYYKEAIEIISKLKLSLSSLNDVPVAFLTKKYLCDLVVSLISKMINDCQRFLKDLYNYQRSKEQQRALNGLKRQLVTLTLSTDVFEDVNRLLNGESDLKDDAERFFHHTLRALLYFVRGVLYYSEDNKSNEHLIYEMYQRSYSAIEEAVKCQFFSNLPESLCYEFIFIISKIHLTYVHYHQTLKNSQKNADFLAQEKNVSTRLQWMAQFENSYISKLRVPADNKRIIVLPHTIFHAYAAALRDDLSLLTDCFQLLESIPAQKAAKKMTAVARELVFYRNFHITALESLYKNKSYSMLIHFMKCINILYGEIKKYEIAHDHHEYIEIINCILNIGVSYIDVLNQFLAQLRLRILFSHDDEHELAKHSEFISFFVKNVDVFVLRIIALEDLKKITVSHALGNPGLFKAYQQQIEKIILCKKNYKNLQDSLQGFSIAPVEKLSEIKRVGPIVVMGSSVPRVLRSKIVLYDFLHKIIHNESSLEKDGLVSLEEDFLNRGLQVLQKNLVNPVTGEVFQVQANAVIDINSLRVFFERCVDSLAKILNSKSTVNHEQKAKFTILVFFIKLCLSHLYFKALKAGVLDDNNLVIDTIKFIHDGAINVIKDAYGKMSLEYKFEALIILCRNFGHLGQVEWYFKKINFDFESLGLDKKAYAKETYKYFDEITAGLSDKRSNASLKEIECCFNIELVRSGSFIDAHAALPSLKEYLNAVKDIGDLRFLRDFSQLLVFFVRQYFRNTQEFLAEVHRQSSQPNPGFLNYVAASLERFVLPINWVFLLTELRKEVQAYDQQAGNVYKNDKVVSANLQLIDSDNHRIIALHHAMSPFVGMPASVRANACSNYALVRGNINLGLVFYLLFINENRGTFFCHIEVVMDLMKIFSPDFRFDIDAENDNRKKLIALFKEYIVFLNARKNIINDEEKFYHGLLQALVCYTLAKIYVEYQNVNESNTNEVYALYRDSHAKIQAALSCQFFFKFPIDCYYRLVLVVSRVHLDSVRYHFLLKTDAETNHLTVGHEEAVMQRLQWMESFGSNSIAKLPLNPEQRRIIVLPYLAWRAYAAAMMDNVGQFENYFSYIENIQYSKISIDLTDEAWKIVLYCNFHLSLLNYLFREKRYFDFIRFAKCIDLLFSDMRKYKNLQHDDKVYLSFMRMILKKGDEYLKILEKLKEVYQKNESPDANSWSELSTHLELVRFFIKKLSDFTLDIINLEGIKNIGVDGITKSVFKKFATYNEEIRKVSKLKNDYSRVLNELQTIYARHPNPSPVPQLNVNVVTSLKKSKFYLFLHNIIQAEGNHLDFYEIPICIERDFLGPNLKILQEALSDLLSTQNRPYAVTDAKSLYEFLEDYAFELTEIIKDEIKSSLKEKVDICFMLIYIRYCLMHLYFNDLKTQTDFDETESIADLLVKTIKSIHEITYYLLDGFYGEITRQQKFDLIVILCRTFSKASQAEAFFCRNSMKAALALNAVVLSEAINTHFNKFNIDDVIDEKNNELAFCHCAEHIRAGYFSKALAELKVITDFVRNSGQDDRSYAMKLILSKLVVLFTREFNSAAQQLLRDISSHHKNPNLVVAEYLNECLMNIYLEEIDLEIFRESAELVRDIHVQLSLKYPTSINFTERLRISVEYLDHNMEQFSGMLLVVKQLKTIVGQERFKKISKSKQENTALIFYLMSILSRVKKIVYSKDDAVRIVNLVSLSSPNFAYTVNVDTLTSQSFLNYLQEYSDVFLSDDSSITEASERCYLSLLQSLIYFFRANLNYRSGSELHELSLDLFDRAFSAMQRVMNNAYLKELSTNLYIYIIEVADKLHLSFVTCHATLKAKFKENAVIQRLEPQLPERLMQYKAAVNILVSKVDENVRFLSELSSVYSVYASGFVGDFESVEELLKLLEMFNKPTSDEQSLKKYLQATITVIFYNDYHLVFLNQLFAAKKFSYLAKFLQGLQDLYKGMTETDLLYASYVYLVDTAIPLFEGYKLILDEFLNCHSDPQKYSLKQIYEFNEHQVFVDAILNTLDLFIVRLTKINSEKLALCQIKIKELIEFYSAAKLLMHKRYEMISADKKPKVTEVSHQARESLKAQSEIIQFNKTRIYDFFEKLLNKQSEYCEKGEPNISFRRDFFDCGLALLQESLVNPVNKFAFLSSYQNKIPVIDIESLCVFFEDCLNNLRQYTQENHSASNLTPEKMQEKNYCHTLIGMISNALCHLYLERLAPKNSVYPHYFDEISPELIGRASGVYNLLIPMLKQVELNDLYRQINRGEVKAADQDQLKAAKKFKAKAAGEISAALHHALIILSSHHVGLMQRIAEFLKRSAYEGKSRRSQTVIDLRAESRDFVSKIENACIAYNSSVVAGKDINQSEYNNLLRQRCCLCAELIQNGDYNQALKIIIELDTILRDVEIVGPELIIAHIFFAKLAVAFVKGQIRDCETLFANLRRLKSGIALLEYEYWSEMLKLKALNESTSPIFAVFIERFKKFSEMHTAHIHAVAVFKESADYIAENIERYTGCSEGLSTLVEETKQTKLLDLLPKKSEQYNAVLLYFLMAILSRHEKIVFNVSDAKKICEAIKESSADFKAEIDLSKINQKNYLAYLKKYNEYLKTTSINITKEDNLYLLLLRSMVCFLYGITLFNSDSHTLESLREGYEWLKQAFSLMEESVAHQHFSSIIATKYRNYTHVFAKLNLNITACSMRLKNVESKAKENVLDEALAKRQEWMENYYRQNIKNLNLSSDDRYISELPYFLFGDYSNLLRNNFALNEFSGLVRRMETKFHAICMEDLIFYSDYYSRLIQILYDNHQLRPLTIFIVGIQQVIEKFKKYQVSFRRHDYKKFIDLILSFKGSYLLKLNNNLQLSFNELSNHVNFIKGIILVLTGYHEHLNQGLTSNPDNKNEMTIILEQITAYKEVLKKLEPRMLNNFRSNSAVVTEHLSDANKSNKAKKNPRALYEFLCVLLRSQIERLKNEELPISFADFKAHKLSNLKEHLINPITGRCYLQDEVNVVVSVENLCKFLEGCRNSLDDAAQKSNDVAEKIFWKAQIVLLDYCLAHLYRSRLQSEASLLEEKKVELIELARTRAVSVYKMTDDLLRTQNVENLKHELILILSHNFGLLCQLKGLPSQDIVSCKEAIQKNIKEYNQATKNGRYNAIMQRFNFCWVLIYQAYYKDALILLLGLEQELNHGDIRPNPAEIYLLFSKAFELFVKFHLRDSKELLSKITVIKQDHYRAVKAKLENFVLDQFQSSDFKRLINTVTNLGKNPVLADKQRKAFSVISFYLNNSMECFIGSHTALKTIHSDQKNNSRDNFNFMATGQQVNTALLYYLLEVMQRMNKVVYAHADAKHVVDLIKQSSPSFKVDLDLKNINFNNFLEYLKKYSEFLEKNKVKDKAELFYLSILKSLLSLFQGILRSNLLELDIKTTKQAFGLIQKAFSYMKEAVANGYMFNLDNDLYGKYVNFIIKLYLIYFAGYFDLKAKDESYEVVVKFNSVAELQWYNGFFENCLAQLKFRDVESKRSAEFIYKTARAYVAAFQDDFSHLEMLIKELDEIDIHSIQFVSEAVFCNEYHLIILNKLYASNQLTHFMRFLTGVNQIFSVREQNKIAYQADDYLSVIKLNLALFDQFKLKLDEQLKPYKATMECDEAELVALRQHNGFIDFILNILSHIFITRLNFLKSIENDAQKIKDLEDYLQKVNLLKEQYWVIKNLLDSIVVKKEEPLEKAKSEEVLSAESEKVVVKGEAQEKRKKKKKLKNKDRVPVVDSSAAQKQAISSTEPLISNSDNIASDQTTADSSSALPVITASVKETLSDSLAKPIDAAIIAVPQPAMSAASSDVVSMPVAQPTVRRSKDGVSAVDSPINQAQAAIIAEPLSSHVDDIASEQTVADYSSAVPVITPSVKEEPSDSQGLAKSIVAPIAVVSQMAVNVVHSDVEPMPASIGVLVQTTPVEKIAQPNVVEVAVSGSEAKNEKTSPKALPPDSPVILKSDFLERLKEKYAHTNTYKAKIYEHLSGNNFQKFVQYYSYAIDSIYRAQIMFVGVREQNEEHYQQFIIFSIVFFGEIVHALRAKVYERLSCDDFQACIQYYNYAIDGFQRSEKIFIDANKQNDAHYQQFIAFCIKFFGELVSVLQAAGQPKYQYKGMFLPRIESPLDHYKRIKANVLLLLVALDDARVGNLSFVPTAEEKLQECTLNDVQMSFCIGLGEKLFSYLFDLDKVYGRLFRLYRDNCLPKDNSENLDDYFTWMYYGYVVVTVEVKCLIDLFKVNQMVMTAFEKAFATIDLTAKKLITASFMKKLMLSHLAKTFEGEINKLTIEEVLALQQKKFEASVAILGLCDPEIAFDKTDPLLVHSFIKWIKVIGYDKILKPVDIVDANQNKPAL